MLRIKLLMAALLAIGFASQTFAGDDETKTSSSKSKTHKDVDTSHADTAKHEKGTDAAPTNVKGPKWSATECNSHCDAEKCQSKDVLVQCAEQCKATPMQVWNCTGAGYLKHCMKIDSNTGTAENVKDDACRKVSYALSAQTFKIWSKPVSSKATPEQLKAASEATKGRFKVTSKFLNNLSKEDLALPEVRAIMSREAKAALKISTIDTDNDTH